MANYEVRLLLGDIITTVEAKNEEEAKQMAYDEFVEQNPNVEVYEVQIED